MICKNINVNVLTRLAFLLNYKAGRETCCRLTKFILCGSESGSYSFNGIFTWCAYLWRSRTCITTVLYCSEVSDRIGT